MDIGHFSNKQLEGIEIEVYEKIKTAVSEDVRKKLAAQEIARETFLAHYHRNSSLTNEGSRIASHVFSGGFAAAEELDWKVEKAVKHLAGGLLAGILETGGDFFVGARLIVRAAIQCAMRTHYDPTEVAERVIGVIQKACSERVCNLTELTKIASRTAIQAAKFAPDKDLATMERMLMGLIAGHPAAGSQNSNGLH